MSPRLMEKQRSDSAAKTTAETASDQEWPGWRRATPKGTIRRMATTPSEDSSWLSPVGPPVEGLMAGYRPGLEAT